MPSVTYYGSFGGNNAGSSGLDTWSTSSTGTVPSGATITGAEFTLDVSANKYTSSKDWVLHWFAVGAEDGSPAASYDTSPMYEDEYTFADTMSFSQADAAQFSEDSIHVYAKANCTHDTVSYMQDWSVTVYYEVYALPTLDSSQPANATITRGNSTTLSAVISADGNPASYTYQWYQNGSAISGATSRQYTAKPNSTSTYYCKVTNKAGTVQTRTATVTVRYTPTLNSAYPTNAVIKAGGSVTLQVKIATAGNPASYTYQWYKDGTIVQGATAATLTVSPSSACTYYCKVSNSVGTVQSRTATVTINSVPTLNSNYPMDASVVPGRAVTLEVRIATDGTPKQYTYQWYKNGSSINGATGNTLEVTVTSSASYYCVVSNAAGSVRSRTAVLATASGGSLFVNNQWVPITCYIWHNGTWCLAEPYVFNSGSWVPCSSG